MHTRCIVKTGGFTRGVCKNRGFFIKFKGFLVERLENRLSPEKIKNPQKIARKVDFSEPRLYNAPSLHTVNLSSPRRTPFLNFGVPLDDAVDCRSFKGQHD